MIFLGIILYNVIFILLQYGHPNDGTSSVDDIE